MEIKIHHKEIRLPRKLKKSISVNIMRRLRKNGILKSTDYIVIGYPNGIDITSNK